jgi:hypothetical protein
MSEIPRTHIFSLNSALGLSLFEGSQPEPLDFAASQTCFAVSGSFAEAWNLSQHWQSQAAAISGNHKPIFVHSSLAAQQVIRPMVVDMVVAALGECVTLCQVLV